MSHLLGDGSAGLELPDDRLLPTWYAPVDLVAASLEFTTEFWPNRSWFLGSYGAVVASAGGAVGAAGGAAGAAASGVRSSLPGGAPVFYSHLTRYGADLYVAYTKVADAGVVTACKILKTSDGLTWVEDKDLLSDGGSCVANIQVLGTDLYVACIVNPSITLSAAGLWRRRLGIWTKVSTAGIAGPLGII